MRFSTPDSLEAYIAGNPVTRIPVSQQAALEETFFLGLRLNRGVDLREAERQFRDEMQTLPEIIDELVSSGLLERQQDQIRLTPRGRLLSNEVFSRFISTTAITM